MTGACSEWVRVSFSGNGAKDRGKYELLGLLGGVVGTGGVFDLCGGIVSKPNGVVGGLIA